MKKEKDTNKIEREYVIPLRERCRPVPRYKKTPKAIKTIKEFLVRHMKIRDRDLKKIKIDKYLNNEVWHRGIKNPPHKIKVKATKEGEIVRVELVDFPDKLKFKKLRAEKMEKAAEELAEGKKKAVDKVKKEAKEEGKDETPKDVHQGGASSSSSPSGKEDINAEGKDKEKKVKEEKEKKSAVVEAGQKIAEKQHKEMKKEIGGKAKEPTRQKRVALGK